MSAAGCVPEGTIAGVVAHGSGSEAVLRRVEAAVGAGARLVAGPLVAAGDAGVVAGRAGPVQVLLQGFVAEAADAERARAADHVASALERSWPDAAGTLSGGWALVAWHEERREVLLARDPMGHDILHYAEGGGEVRFAGTVPALLSLLPATPAPDRAAVHAWLAMGGRFPGEGLHAGVHHLRPGEGLLVGAAGAARVRLARPSAPAVEITDRREAVAELRAALEVAVERSLAPDGVSGILLSGGLDSGSVAAVAALVARRTGARLHTFSGTFPGLARTDERQLIDDVVAAVGADHTRMVVGGRALLPGAVDYALRWRSPLGPPAFALWDALLRDEAPATGAGVLLDGNGGDEMFAWSAPLVADRLKRLRLLSARDLARRTPGALRHGSRRFTFENLWSSGIAPLLPPGLTRRRGGGDPWMRRDGAAIARRVGDLSGVAPFGREPLWWRSRQHAVVDMADVFGAYEYTRQAYGMAGLRPRHPLRDAGVLDVVQRTDPALTFDPAFNRVLLRDAVAGLLPDSVRLRPGKSVFDPLLAACVHGWDAPLLRRVLEDPGALLREYVDLDAVQAPLRRALEPGAGTPVLLRKVWRLAATELWLRAEADPDGARALVAGARTPEVGYERVQAGAAAAAD